MTQPVGIQLRRTARWNLQQVSIALNGLPARAVTRPGPFGNPFTIALAIESGYADADSAPAFVVECFDDWLAGGREGRDWWQGDEADRRRALTLKLLPELRGHNLACGCGLDAPCHRNVLLQLANA